MFFDFAEMSGRESYKLLSSTIVPRPIAWVVTRSELGLVNAAPFSFFNAFSGDPPVICIGIGEMRGRQKDTMANLCATGEFVVNMVSYALVDAMNLTSFAYAPGVNELEIAGLQTVESMHVAPPRIALSPASFECKVRQFINLGDTNNLVIADVLAGHILDSAISDAKKCRVDSAKLDLVGRMESPGWYIRLLDRFLLPMPTLPHAQSGLPDSV